MSSSGVTCDEYLQNRINLLLLVKKSLFAALVIADNAATQTHPSDGLYTAKRRIQEAIWWIDEDVSNLRSSLELRKKGKSSDMV